MTFDGHDVAIIGIGCRYPGGHGADALWRLLLDRRCSVDKVPADRPALAELAETDSPARFGGFIDGVEEFDAEFFGVSPREAAKLDPQRRILMETVWEALEDAGIPPSTLAGSDTGVFVGEQATDHWDLVRGPNIDLHTLVGSHQRAALSGRVSYWFDLRGPSYSVEAACASSLVAVLDAVSALRAGRCRICLAAGSNLILTPDQSLAYAGAEALAGDGRCKFGDAGSDGFIRSDGVGVLILKRLADAVDDGDDIYAVIRGGAVGHDGRTSGNPMQPAADGQVGVISAALADAGLTAADLGYIEAHGTGTAAGDAAELAGLERLMSAAGRSVPCPIGSIKSNIGHTEAAAGIAGMIKAAYALRHGVIPASLHLRTPNPAIEWRSVELTTSERPWPDEGRDRYAGVSSFGISGVNSHIVLASAPRRAAQPSAPPPLSVLAVSARSEAALRELTDRHIAALADPATSVPDFCASAALRREHFPHRLAVTGTDAAELISGLRSAVPTPPVRRRLVFVYSGHGSQWAGMARELIEQSPVFRDVIRECDSIVAKENGWSLWDMLHGSQEEDYLTVDRVHPMLFSIQVAFTALLKSWGLEPDAVVGHSMGEVAAAHAAGMLTLDDAIPVICRRSRLLARLRGTGMMAWVELPRAAAEREIADVADHVSIAIVNSESSTVLTGDRDAITAIMDRLDERDVFCRPVAIDLPAHSPAVDALVDEMAGAITEIRPRPGTIPLHSTVLDRVVAGTELGPRYWADNLRSPVLFGSALRSVLADGPSAVVEISPHPIVLTAINEAIGDDDVAVAVQLRGKSQLPTALECVARLYTAGFDPDWGAIVGDRPPAKVPTHPFQRDRFPLPTSSRPTDPTLTLETPPVRPPHPFLITFTKTHHDDGAEWEGQIDSAYLLDHRVDGRPLLPTTAHLDLALSAARELDPHGFDERAAVLRDVSMLRSVHVDAADTRVRIRLRSRDSGWWFETAARNADTDWNLVAEGEITTAELTEPTIPSVDGDPFPPSEFYGQMRERGNDWGGVFQSVIRIERKSGMSAGEVQCPPELAEGHAFHPALLDACVQVACAALPPDPRQFVGASVEYASFHREPGDRLDVVATARTVDSRAAAADVWISDAKGFVAELRGVRLSYLDRDPVDRLREAVYRVEWDEVSQPHQGAASRYWILTDDRGVGAALADELVRAGDHVVVVATGERTHRTAADLREVDPLDSEGLARILAESADSGGGKLVDCRGLDIDSLADAERACLDVAAAVRAIAWSGLDIGLLLATSGAQIGCEQPEQAALWGLGRALANERPRLDVRLVDLDPADPLRGLATEARASVHEGQIAQRGGRRLAPRLRPHMWKRLPSDSELAVSERFLRVGPDGKPGAVAGVVTQVGTTQTAVSVGDEVIALPADVSTGTSSPVVADHLVRRVPPNLSPAEAAATADYVTAYLALHDHGNVSAGEKVLIIGAATGTGLAVAALARDGGARLSAVCETPEQCAVLRHLGAEWAGTDPTTSAEADLVIAVGGPPQGGPAGRVVVIGEADSQARAFTLDAFAARDPQRVKKVFDTVMRLVEEGSITPLPYRTRANSGLVGDMVLPAQATIRDDRTYLISGGLGDLGLEIAEWLIRRGARHLLLLGRSAPDETRAARVRGMRGNVRHAPVDVADQAALRAVLAAHDGPPVAGVVHAAGVLDTTEVADLTADHVRSVFAGKAHGAAAIDAVLTGLDFVVLFSAGSALLGFPFLGGYAAANAYLDALAQRHRADGEPWLSVNWGYWAGVGMAARRQRELGRDLVPTGMSAFTPAGATSVLADLMDLPIAQAAVLPTDWHAWADHDRQAARSPLLSDFLDTEPKRPPVASPDIGDLREQVGVVLGLPAERVRPDLPLNEQGLDSLLAIELRTLIERRAGVLVPVARILRRTLTDLADELGGGQVTRQPPERPAQQPAQQVTGQPLEQSRQEPAPRLAPAATPAPSAPSADLVAEVRVQVAEILGTSEHRVATDVPVNDLGLDSLLGMQLRSALEEHHGVTVPVAKLFRRSVGEIAHVVADALGQNAGGER